MNEKTNVLKHFYTNKKQINSHNSNTIITTESLCESACVCVYFINCFMSGRYSMSLKHALCLTVSITLTLTVSLYMLMFIVYVNENKMLPLLLLLLLLLLYDPISLINDRRNILWTSETNKHIQKAKKIVIDTQLFYYFTIWNDTT